MTLKVGDIVKHKLTGQQMIVISTQVEIDVGEINLRYFNEVTGDYGEISTWGLSEIEEINK